MYSVISNNTPPAGHPRHYTAVLFFFLNQEKINYVTEMANYVKSGRNLFSFKTDLCSNVRREDCLEFKHSKDSDSSTVLFHVVTFSLCLQCIIDQGSCKCYFFFLQRWFEQ